jgi:hypothetical protein
MHFNRIWQRTIPANLKFFYSNDPKPPFLGVSRRKISLYLPKLARKSEIEHRAHDAK